MVLELLQALLQPGRDFLHMREHLVGLVDAQGFQCHGAGQRMPAVGVAVTENTDAGAGVGNRLVDLVGKVERRHRDIGRGQHFGDRDHVGFQVKHLGAKSLPQPAETCDDFIDQKQDVVLFQDRLNFRKVARGWNDDAAGALHRLGNEGGDGIGAFAQDRVLQFLGQTIYKLGFGLARQAELVEVRAADAHNAWQRQVEVLVHAGQTRHGSGGSRDTVVALVARDDFLLQRPTLGVVVVAHQFEGGVVGLGTRVGKQHTRHRYRSPLDHRLHQLGHRPWHLARERVVIGQGAHLAEGGVGQTLFGKSERSAPEPGHAFDVGLAMLVEYLHAFAAHNHQRPVALMVAQLGVGMQMVPDVALSGAGEFAAHVVPVFLVSKLVQDVAEADILDFHIVVDAVV